MLQTDVHAGLAQGRLRAIGAEQAIPPGHVESVVAVRFSPSSVPTVPSGTRSFAGLTLSMATACLKSAARRECTIRPSAVS